MFCHIACQGNRQIVVEAQAWLPCFVIHLQSLDRVDFLIRLPFGEQDSFSSTDGVSIEQNR